MSKVTPTGNGTNVVFAAMRARGASGVAPMIKAPAPTSTPVAPQ